MAVVGTVAREIRHTVSRRLPELRDKGVVRECGERICRVGGRKSIVWDVTDALPVPGVARKVLLTPAEKSAALRALRRIYNRLEQRDQDALLSLGRWLAQQVDDGKA
jgi:hypothetical protein